MDHDIQSTTICAYTSYFVHTMAFFYLFPKITVCHLPSTVCDSVYLLAHIFCNMCTICSLPFHIVRVHLIKPHQSAGGGEVERPEMSLNYKLPHEWRYIAEGP